VLITSWRFLSNVSSPEEAEALACLEGVRLALEWMSRPIEIETDCLELVKALKSDVNMWARWAGIIGNQGTMLTVQGMQGHPCPARGEQSCSCIGPAGKGGAAVYDHAT
jgi:hypothetical protein